MNTQIFKLVGFYISFTIFFTSSLFAASTNFQCANPKLFSAIYSANLYGKLITAGNTSLCFNKDGKGICEDPGNKKNNDINMMNNDYDDTLNISDHAATSKNSSAAYLDIPENKKVVWAGLTWQGYMVDWTDEDKQNGHKIKYKHESDTSYQIEGNAEMNWIYFNSTRMYYQGFVDITDYVNEYKGGYYWVGDIATQTGLRVPGGGFGAWSITVVYEDKNEDFNNITVYNGYQAFANNTDFNNAKTYAQDHNCDTNNIGVGRQVSSHLSGFLTPKNGIIKSNLVVFAGEGDTELTGDSGTLTDKNNNAYKLSNSLNPSSNIMNSTISYKGETVTTGLPYYSANSLGADIDTFDVSYILSNEQTETDITFSTVGDGYMPGLYGLQIQLRVATLCYDYTFGQSGNFLSAPSIKPAMIQGNFNGNPVDVKLYFKNLENSDVNINSLEVNIDPIDGNTSYKPDSTYITRPDDIFSAVLDRDHNTSTYYNNNIPIGDVNSLQYFYLYYSLYHTQSELNALLNATLTYNLSINFNGQLIDLGRQSKKISDMNPCQSGTNYNPVPGRFNIVHDHFNGRPHADGTSRYYYNLPTQTVNRAGHYKLQSLDAYDLNKEKGVPTLVAIEMVDVAGFHYATATCTDQNTSSNGSKIWALLENNETLYVDLDQTELLNAGFFNKAIKNAAFRLSYNVGDANEVLELNTTRNGRYKLTNFTTVAGEPCSPSFSATHNGATQSHYCGDNGQGTGQNGMSEADLKTCMECIYGIKTNVLCSRDNFSIRPEAFLINIDDQNDSNSSLTTNITSGQNYSGGVNAVAPEINLAADYDYTMELNATSHTSNNAAQGYYPSLDANYTWSPLAGKNISGCNDTTNKPITISFNDGHAEDNTSVAQVGRYNFELNDTQWTKVDYDLNLMAHHYESEPSIEPYFKAGKDCVLDNHTELQSSYNLQGCYISSNHLNPENNFRYNNYNVNFHPYRFNLSTITPTTGLNQNAVTANANTQFIYMANINNSQDENMSFHLNGNIDAVGKHNASLSNFVDQCYAVPLDINIATDNRDLNDSNGNNVNYMIKFHDMNATTNTIIPALDINQTDNQPSSDIQIQLTQVYFDKNSSGSTQTALNLNYDRANNAATNPKAIQFIDYKVNCTNSATDCTFSADLLNNKTPLSSQDINTTIKNYYGRTHAPRQRYVGDSGDAFIYYEVFCDVANDGNKSLLQNGLSSRYTDDPRWFVNTAHQTARDGQVNAINQKGYSVGAGSVTPSVINTATPTVSTLNYNSASTRGYPYKATMELNNSNWLIYSKYDINATKNEFEVEFVNSAGNWAGQTETDSTTKINAAKVTNRRLMW